ncbi:uncharacterized protein CC84DRAFT_1227488 [Paraphaeosphaeria sporulosa]|uniref:Uncharacterized protein n=1 Tax=Paraphaeosphaeria sporulosa TaxID=1460663 RepID=A0A177CZ50_9PLEO|nr:uncharacterized protein CC84DRAFT_1227488 [Paraphaeosphaeria sporulosa]OAG12814.1 hypothetical protein CC84DRAFT_1227488 [Paraphaeosphaeria sporulosa]
MRCARTPHARRWHRTLLCPAAMLVRQLGGHAAAPALSLRSGLLHSAPGGMFGAKQQPDGARASISIDHRQPQQTGACALAAASAPCWVPERRALWPAEDEGDEHEEERRTRRTSILHAPACCLTAGASAWSPGPAVRDVPPRSSRAGRRGGGLTRGPASGRGQGPPARHAR